MTSTVTDANELFDLLESSRPSTVADIKNLIAEHFNTVRESWLVGGLFDYYLQTDSCRTVEILCGISKEPHDKYLIERILDGIRNVNTRKQSLMFLGHLVRKQPSWLYRIFQCGLFRELIKILKTETDVVVLVTGLLIVITLLPISPMYLAPHVNEIFEVFSRLAMWTHTNNQEVAEEQLLHLQVGLYSLFHRLYAMYPCNFLSYLRHNFSSSDKGLVFHHTLKPMLETVKMHPFLVTATKDTELSPHRWKSKEYHDVIAECSKLSIDVHESGVCEENSFRPRLPSMLLSSEGPAQGSSVVTSTLEVTEMSNLLNFVEEIGTAPTTPITSASHVNILTPPNADETAMEATPENTPLQTPVKDRERLVFKLPERASTAAMHLNFGSSKSVYSFPPSVPNSTPINSVPSSPLPQTEPIRRESNASELNLGRRDSVLFQQRLQKILVEQQQQQHNESKGLTINIPSQADSDASQEPPGGPLTPLLQPTAELDDPPPPCQHEGPCRGGLHMPDTKSLIAFATRVKRLRFYSHCEDTIPAKVKVKRSLSCPDIKEEPVEELEEQQPPEEPPRPCYEHLFEGILDVWGEEENGSSPHVLLDECVKKAASLHGGGNGNPSEGRLKAHIELLHNQLLFERHRREAHTLRNRRLASKARRAQICEEQNLTYRAQIHQLEKEIASLKKEMMRQRNSNHLKESELCNTINDLESKQKTSKNTIESLEAQNTDALEQYRQLQEEHSAITKDADKKSAVIFALESEIKHCKNYLTANTELQEAYQAAQKDIIMLGELCRRQEEVLGAIEPTRFIEDVDDLKITYEEELRSLRNMLESKSSQCEASQGYIQDLEQTLTTKNKVIEDLKKCVHDTGVGYHVQLRAMEDKYIAVKAMNQRLELEILNLQHQVSVKNSAGSGAIGDTFIRNGVSPTDSDVTVDSAASAGGFGGLSSPERNVFIFGSPQFDNSAPQQSLMSDLRQNID